MRPPRPGTARAVLLGVTLAAGLPVVAESEPLTLTVRARVLAPGEPVRFELRSQGETP